MIDKLADLTSPEQYRTDAADADIIVGQPRAADFFHQVIDGFPFSERMHERRHGADVLAESADGDQMAGDAIELARNYPAEFPSPVTSVPASFPRPCKRLISEHRG